MFGTQVWGGVFRRAADDPHGSSRHGLTGLERSEEMKTFEKSKAKALLFCFAA
jgi:hypothetical protein